MASGVPHHAPKKRRPDPFWQPLWQELQPIIRHAIVFLLTELAVLAVGLMTLALKYLLPDHEPELAVLGSLDIWLALAILCLFAFATLIQVLGLVGKMVTESWLGSLVKWIWAVLERMLGR